MITPRPSACFAGLLLLAGSAFAKSWTVTKYYAVQTSVSSWGEDLSITRTRTYPVKTDAPQPTNADAFSTYTSSRTYDSLDIVELYIAATEVGEDELLTSASFNNDYTLYFQDLVYTAPESCPTQFKFTTSTVVNVPSEAADQVTPTRSSVTVTTGRDGSEATTMTAWLPANAAIATPDTKSDYAYTEYIEDCRSPTSLSGDDEGPRIGGGNSDSGSDGSSGSVFDVCRQDSYCFGLYIGLIIVVALIPACFVLGFLENYFWFRRMMIGKFSLRFGTCLWIFLCLPVLCFTRQCPARDAQTQQALRAQWKNVSFGKALGLWFKYGFRRRYPVELLGNHPLYHNPAPGHNGQVAPVMGQLPPGPPPLGGYVYYAPGPDAQHQQAGLEAYKMPDQSVQQATPPPPGMTMYYPQQPQQAYQPQQPYQSPPQQPYGQPGYGAPPQGYAPPPQGYAPVASPVSAPDAEHPRPTASPQPYSMNPLSELSPTTTSWQPQPRSEAQPRPPAGPPHPPQ